LYAENLAQERRIDGAGREEAILLEVSNSKFDHLAGESFLYDDAREASFYRVVTPDEWVDHTETFECLVEQPEHATR
jgi:hypothetical protein